MQSDIGKGKHKKKMQKNLPKRFSYFGKDIVININRNTELKEKLREDKMTEEIAEEKEKNE